VNSAGPNLRPRWELPLVLLAGACVLVWCWRIWCLFPGYAWNEVRLSPLLLWWEGASPYAAPGGGQTTTWIYGPAPLASMWLVVAASSAAGALLIAATINLLTIILPLWCVMRAGAQKLTAARWSALLLAVALWPSHNFRFFQPDTLGVSLGLFSMLALLRGQSARCRWVAAACCAGAILSKQTFVTLAAAQAVYLTLHSDWRAAGSYVARVGAVTAAGLVAAFALLGSDAVIYHLWVLPARLPWVESVPARLVEFWPYFAAHLAVPLILFRLSGEKIWRRDSPLLLPMLVFAASWPLDLMATFKFGGSINSLHGALLAGPFTLARLIVLDRRPALSISLTSAAATIVALAQIATTGPGIWKPNTEHLRQGDALARQLPGQVYFPWNPLITYYAEQRIDEVEDGLFIRFFAGEPLPARFAHLPPKFSAIAFPDGTPDWGIARRLAPADHQTARFGSWTIVSWPRDSAAPDEGRRL